MFGIILRTVAALVSLGVAGFSLKTLTIVSRNPWADSILMIGGWVMVLGLAAFCVVAFSLSLSREVLGRTGR